MISNPLNTVACVPYKVDQIVSGIEKYAIQHPERNQLQRIGVTSPYPVYAFVHGSDCTVKPFDFPLKVVIDSEDAYVFDARNSTRTGGFSSYTVTNPADFGTMSLVSSLSCAWDSDDQSIIANLAAEVLPIYATWQSSTISAAFNLGVDQRTEVMIVAALYYWNLLGIEGNPDKVALRISIDLKVDIDKVFEMASLVGEGSDISTYIEALKGTSAGVRLEKLDTALLYQVSTGAWPSTNGRTLLSIGIQYPPIILAMTSLVTQDKSYRRGRFRDYVSIYDRRPAIATLSQTLAKLLYGG